MKNNAYVPVNDDESMKRLASRDSALSAYIKNGNSLEGLPEEVTRTFGKIKVFKTKDRQ
jgi:hypothetical protein